jgi:hypothetical protein
MIIKAQLDAIAKMKAGTLVCKPTTGDKLKSAGNCEGVDTDQNTTGCQVDQVDKSAAHAQAATTTGIDTSKTAITDVDSDANMKAAADAEMETVADAGTQAVPPPLATTTTPSNPNDSSAKTAPPTGASTTKPDKKKAVAKADKPLPRGAYATPGPADTPMCVSPQSICTASVISWDWAGIFACASGWQRILVA